MLSLCTLASVEAFRVVADQLDARDPTRGTKDLGDELDYLPRCLGLAQT